MGVILGLACMLGAGCTTTTAETSPPTTAPLAITTTLSRAESDWCEVWNRTHVTMAELAASGGPSGQTPAQVERWLSRYRGVVADRMAVAPATIRAEMANVNDWAIDGRASNDRTSGQKADHDRAVARVNEYTRLICGQEGDF